MTSPDPVRQTFDVFFATEPDVLAWGLAKAGEAPHASELTAWVAEGFHAGLSYMEKNLPERRNPRLRLGWAETLLLFSLRQPRPFARHPGPFAVAAYAQGSDYHDKARGILARLAKTMASKFPEMRIDPFVDTAPVFERDFAAAAGLGWRGKNACLISPRHGSGFLLAGALLDAQLEPSGPQQDFCGACTACLDACPTGALTSPGKLDARLCLSHATIEHKGEFPESLAPKLSGWIFGCDICQSVCPWNRKHSKDDATPITTPSGHPWPQGARDWLGLLRKGGGFQSAFKGTPLQRAGRKAMLRNVLLVLSQNPAPSLLPLLESLREEEEAESVLKPLDQAREACKA